jgi:hypothetical protein
VVEETLKLFQTENVGNPTVPLLFQALVEPLLPLYYTYQVL